MLLDILLTCYPHQKNAYFSQVSYHTSFQDPNDMLIAVLPLHTFIHSPRCCYGPQQIHKNSNAMFSSGIMFLSYFVKFSHRF